MSIRFRLVFCFLPRSISSFHHCFGIDLRADVVSANRGRAGWKVRFAVIWIKDYLSSTASDKPWGRSHLCIWETVDQTCFSSQMYMSANIMSTLWVMIREAFVLVLKHPLLCSTSANLLILCKWNQAVELIVIPIPLLSSYQATSMQLTFNDHAFDCKEIGIII